MKIGLKIEWEKDYYQIIGSRKIVDSEASNSVNASLRFLFFWLSPGKSLELLLVLLLAAFQYKSYTIAPFLIRSAQAKLPSVSKFTSQSSGSAEQLSILQSGYSADYAQFHCLAKIRYNLLWVWFSRKIIGETESLSIETNRYTQIDHEDHGKNHKWTNFPSTN